MVINRLFRETLDQDDKICAVFSNASFSVRWWVSLSLTPIVSAIHIKGIITCLITLIASLTGKESMLRVSIYRWLPKILVKKKLWYCAQFIMKTPKFVCSHCCFRWTFTCYQIQVYIAMFWSKLSCMQPFLKMSLYFIFDSYAFGLLKASLKTIRKSVLWYSFGINIYRGWLIQKIERLEGLW